MRDSEARNVPQNFERVEFLHDDVRRAERGGSESHDSGGMRKRRNIQANGVRAIATPVVRGHVGHRAPGKRGDPNSLCGTSRSTRGNQADEPVDDCREASPQSRSEISLPESMKDWSEG